MVEHRLPKPGVAGSIPVSRSNFVCAMVTSRQVYIVIRCNLDSTAGFLTVHTVQNQEVEPHTAAICATAPFLPCRKKL